MRKAVIIFLILLTIISVSVKSSHCEESKEKPSVDYMQKYYEQIAKAKEEQEQKVGEFEPTTPLGKFMGHFVGAFSIVSVVGVFVAWILIGMLGEEGIWLTLTKAYTAVASYFVINYCVWVALKLVKIKCIDLISGISLITTAILYASVAYLIYSHNADLKKASQIPTWRCPKCNASNHYNDVCWNCNTAKAGPPSS